MRRNDLKDEGFSEILKGCLSQDGIEMDMISYHHNELGKDSI